MQTRLKPRQHNRNDKDWLNWLIKAGTQLVTRLVVLGILLLTIVGVIVTALTYSSILPQSPNLVTDLVRGVGIGLVIAAVTSGVISLLIARSPKEFQEQLNLFLKEDVTSELGKLRTDTTNELEELRTDTTNQLGDLQRDIREQTTDLIGISKSLIALNQTGISRVYAKRSEAADDMIQDLRNKNLTEIQVIGISLNDFIPDEKTELHRVWKEIEAYIRPEHPVSKQNPPLDIKVLIIDPDCLGAYLRSVGENRENQIRGSRLSDDVYSTSKPLRVLKEVADKNFDTTGVRFNFRFYQLPPIFFLLRTNIASYVEPYYFWASRSTAASMPIYRCSSLLQSGMKDHFNLIWDSASLSPEQFFDQHYVGIDRGINQCGAINVFLDGEQARKRMVWHLKQAKRRIWLQGVSLRSFFDEGLSPNNLYAEIQRAFARGIEIRILLLDPESEQASFRAFRERLLRPDLPHMTLQEYQQNQTERQKDRLYRETNESIDQIRRIVRVGNKNLQVKLYSAAPSCFMLLVDDVVLVEQFQYGKIAKADENDLVNPVLGKDMPLIEYAHTPTNLFEPVLGRNAFQLMEDHFKYVFKECAYPIDPPIDVQ